MTTQEAKQIRIAEYLQTLGYTPVKRQGNSLWYKITAERGNRSVVQGEHRIEPMVRLRHRQGRQYHRIGCGTLPFRQCVVFVGAHRQTDTKSAHDYPCAFLFWSAIRLRTDVPTPASYGTVLSCAAVLFAGARDKHRTRQEGMSGTPF